jgi:lambda family phage portal protein
MARNDSQYMTCLQLIESDRLSNPLEAFPSWNLRGGIELDPYGRPLAYYIQKIPTGLAGLYFPGIGGVEWDRIPAETSWGRKRVIHAYVQERPDQTRGKPILAPIIEQFRMLDSYQRTELQSAIVNSLVAGVIETPLDPAGIVELMGGDPNAYLDQKNEYRIQLEGGSMIPLYPGDKLQPFVPARPAAQFGAFVEAVYRQIGSALGLPYELVMKDFSKTNYSSARAALNEAWRFFMNRRQWLGTYWASVVYRLWLEEAVALGQVEAPDFYNLMPLYCRAKWIGPGRGTIDPVKEAQAAQLRINAGISTLEDECAEQGLDWEEVAEQRAVEIQRYEELNLPIVPPAVPSAKLQEPGEQPAGQPGQQQEAT